MAGPDTLDALVESAQSGDVRAFEALVSAYLPQVRRFARAFAGAQDSADDLAQEALLKVYRSLRQYRGESAFSTWLFAVVRNAFLDAARGRGARERSREATLEHLGPEEESDRPGPDVLLEQEEARRQVWEALRQVAVEFRSALVLFDIEGRSYEEVAAIERVPIGTVKSRLSRGRAQLRKLLAPEAGTSAGPATSYQRRDVP